MMKSKAFYYTFPSVWVVTLLVALILWLAFGKQDLALSYVLGSATSLWAMSMLNRSGKNILNSETDEAQARKRTAINYVIRFLLYAVVLVVAGLRDNLDIITVAAGLLTFKLLLYINLFIERRKGGQNG